MHRPARARRRQHQPFTPAHLHELRRQHTAGEERLVVVRLYDVGQGAMQMVADRLVSVENAHAPRLAA